MPPRPVLLPFCSLLLVGCATGGGPTASDVAETAGPRPMAVFDAAYQRENGGRVRYSVPEVYELVNVAIALTPTAGQDPYMVARETPYYREVQAHFAPVRDHPLVQAFDRELRDGAGYFSLKMNGNAFAFDGSGRIRRSRIYDRTGFNGEPSNVLVPYLAEMQDFSDRSRFRAFYASHRPLYEEQIRYFQREIDADAMLAWLRAQFPQADAYDTVSVVFSPLVYANQSVTWIESGGFSELQPHINFPYPSATPQSWSPTAQALRRGYLLFTEMNHGFINPTADLHSGAIEAAIRNRGWWTNPGSPGAGYQDDLPFFNEMMNWGLVSLYLWDRAPAAERDALIEALGPYMVQRGFVRFPEFNRFLVDLYAERAPGTTVASLYPHIIDWFARQEDRQAPAG